jgi:hypothetical protein
VIVIEHNHTDGTLVHGTARGDGTNLVIKSVHDGWKFSRKIGTDGAWYQPHSRDRDADRAIIERLAEALHAAGHDAEIRIDNTPRSTAEVETDRAARVAGRVDRYTELADARHRSGGARLDHTRERRSLAADTAGTTGIGNGGAEPWTEVFLLCTDHAAAFHTAAGHAESLPAVSYKRLS